MNGRQAFWQLRRVDGALAVYPLKTGSSRRVLALDAATVKVLRRRQRAQLA